MAEATGTIDSVLALGWDVEVGVFDDDLEVLVTLVVIPGVGAAMGVIWGEMGVIIVAGVSTDGGSGLVTLV